MNKKIISVFVMTIGLLSNSLPTFGHHAFSAEFDATKPVRLEGKINRMEWINPHSWLHVDVINDAGEMETWMVEAGPAGVLVRRGWRKDSIVTGTEVVVEGYQARDGSNRANGRDVTLPNGERLFAGSTGPGAPPETGEQ